MLLPRTHSDIQKSPFIHKQFLQRHGSTNLFKISWCSKMECPRDVGRTISEMYCDKNGITC
jgi:hypothetical protein